MAKYNTNSSKITISLKRKYRDQYQAQADKLKKPLAAELRDTLEKAAELSSLEKIAEAAAEIRARAMKAAKDKTAEGMTAYFLAVAELRTAQQKIESALEGLRTEYESA